MDVGTTHDISTQLVSALQKLLDNLLLFLVLGHLLLPVE